MIRSIIAVVVGIAITALTFMVFEVIGYLIYIKPLGIDLSNEEALNEFARNAPLGALLLLLCGYFVGTFIGVTLAVRIACRAPVIHALIICILFMVGNLSNLLGMPHPIWFWFASFAIFPIAAVAAVLVAGPAPKPLVS